MRTSETCPVCKSASPRYLDRFDGKDYFACPTCEARFLHPEFFLKRDEELAHYQLHENEIDDPAYRNFLSKLYFPLVEKLKPGAKGLDYGCGPGPALAAMFEGHGFEMALYDPFFYPDIDAIESKYDFITCTETAEHFHAPWEEFQRLDELLNPGGVIGVMTCFQTDDALFENWHYRKDPTHVVFYREKTFEVIANQHGWQIEIPQKDVVIFKKP